MNAFGFPWSGENCWITVTYKAIVRVWRALREQQAFATVLIHMWESSTWWHLVAPDGRYLSEIVVDWVWFPRGDPNLFIGGTAPGRTLLPPYWPLLTIRVDFSQGEARLSRHVISKRDRCLQGGCDACKSNSWYRQQ